MRFATVNLNPQRALRSSPLSPRERAGARGKGAFANLPLANADTRRRRVKKRGKEKCKKMSLI
jgi:hypothetical protein